MAIESQHTRLGTPLPDVTVEDLDGSSIALPQYRGDGCLVVWWAANHCPYVQHVEAAVGQVAQSLADQDVRFIAIMSNDVQAYPQDDSAGMREQVERAGWTFPYARDLDQSIARTFGAVCTPDFFVYGREGTLAYRGAFDSSSPKNGVPLTGQALAAALRAVLADEPVPLPHRPALGCGIKWSPGNEPEAVSFT